MKRAVLESFAILILTYLAIPPPASLIRGRSFQSLTVTDRNGVVLREVHSAQGGVAQWVALDEMSPYLIQATVLAEDRRFYQHPGVDILAMARALRTNIRAGRIVSGGSTITEQLVHSVYGLPRHSIAAKLFEVLEAIRFELHLSKAQILEAYLNRVPYANQTFGCEAAAGLYFGMSCNELSIAEAAFLAAIPRSPEYYDPYRHPENTRARQQWILRQLKTRNQIDDLQYKLAGAERLNIQPRENNFRAPHFVDWVLAQRSRTQEEPRMNTDKHGVHPCSPVVSKNEGPLQTTLDVTIQDEVERLLRKTVQTLRGSNVSNGAALVIDRRSGEILAMAGSADYFRPDGGQVNAVLSRRQPGSALKPFTYELALEQGATAADLLPDLEFHAPEPAGAYLPRNYDETYHGPVRLRTALACSYNVPAIRTLEWIGPNQLLTRLHALGFASLDQPASHYGLALTLGDGDVTLLELVRAYACLANGGTLIPLTAYRLPPTAVRADPCVCPVQAQGPAPTLLTPHQVMDDQAAYIITDILSDNTARIPAFGEYSVLNLGFPCAVKTGTSKDYRDNWTIGYTDDYVVGVWIGNFDGSPMHNVSGVTGAGPLFHAIMEYLNPKPPLPFARPDGIEEVEICPVSGQLCGPDCPDRMTELFRAGTEPQCMCSVHQRVRLDVRTGLAAGPATPPEDIEDKVFTVFPPLYYGWMQSVGLPFPPVAAESAASDDLAIIYPGRNSIFKIDPTIDRKFQSIELCAEAPPDCEEVRWRVDDSVVASVERPFSCFWPLRAGRHRITCETTQGQRDEVSVLVLK
jgi:penicillin-binding protein 1C